MHVLTPSSQIYLSWPMQDTWNDIYYFILPITYIYIFFLNYSYVFYVRTIKYHVYSKRSACVGGAITRQCCRYVRCIHSIDKIRLYSIWPKPSISSWTSNTHGTLLHTPLMEQSHPSLARSRWDYNKWFITHISHQHSASPHCTWSKNNNLIKQALNDEIQ